MTAGDKGIRPVRIGVLGLQGGVAEHLAMLADLQTRQQARHLACQLAVEARPFVTADALTELDAVILPGGESTAIGKLLDSQGLLEPLRARIAAGMPVWGTCAGMILLARHIENDQRRHLALMDISISRNSWGRQVHSFVENQEIAVLGAEPFPMVFVRAPRILELGPDVQPLARARGEVVACRQGNMVATTFHPELTEDGRFHAWFVGLARAVVRRQPE